MSPSETSKNELRGAMRRWRREELDDEEHEQRSQSICRHLLESDLVPDSGRVVLFAPIGNEVDLLPFVEGLPRSITIVLPRVDGDELLLHDLPDRDGFVESLRTGRPAEGYDFGAHDVLEPDPGASEEISPGDVALVVVPGLVFDDSGGRIGYGAGYYDRFLAKLPSGTRTVGVCFSRQLVGEPIPQESHDQPVDAVVTEDGFQ